MIVGAFALAAYSWTVCLLLEKNQMSSWFATMLAMIAWIAHESSEKYRAESERD